MTTVLLTGFEPFGGDGSNPSGAAVRVVAQRWTGPEILITEVLPVTFAGAAGRLRELLAAHRPDVVVAAGLAGGRRAVGVERVAVNLIDARIPDNAGLQPIDEPSAEDAPVAHFSTLPVKGIVRALDEAGIPAEVSHSAGTFVCNHLFFTTMNSVPAGVRAGFIHVPWSDEDGPAPGEPSLPLGAIVRALEVVIRTTLTGAVDVAIRGGALH